jgi:hypothetical protein
MWKGKKMQENINYFWGEFARNGGGETRILLEFPTNVIKI